jgi:hypothetical protein
LVVVIAIAAAVLGVTVVPNLRTRGRQSDAAIEKELLADVPLGSRIETVEAYAKDRFGEFGRLQRGGNWEVFVLYDRFLTLDMFPGGTSVRVAWQFDADRRPAGVTVQRTRYAWK